MRLQVRNLWDPRKRCPISRKRLGQLTAAVLAAEGRVDADIEVSVAFCGDDAIQELNRRYRGKDRPTDVLSFPLDDEGALGDVLISVPTVVRQAGAAGHSTRTEADWLFVHSLLHLLGYEDETDTGAEAMRAAGFRVFAQLGERLPETV